MKRFGVPLLALLLAGAAAPAPAQNGPPPGAGMNRAPQQGPGGAVRGSVVDEATGQPVAGAAVSVWSGADSTLVAGAVGQKDGTFRIEGLRPGRYYVRVSFLGYTPANSAAFAITPADPQAEVGTLRLGKSAVALEGLEVRAERNTVSMAPDRNTYSAKELAPAGGTATDVLQNVPAIEVDADGKVSLRGNTNVAVQINGRPAPMRGEQLAAFLRQLPSNMIERVEVVPNPSAKYDPEGMAGIVNLVLKQNADLGTSGGLVLGMGSGDRYNASGNLGYQKGRLTLFGSYGFNLDARASTGYHLRENRFLDPHTFLRQDIDGRMEMEGHVFNSSADLRLSGKDVLSSTFLLSNRGIENGSLNAFRELTADRTLTGRFDNVSASEMSDFTFDYSLAFKRTMEPQRHELSAEARLNRSRNEMLNDFTRRPLTLQGAPLADPGHRDRNEQDAAMRNLTLQLDYTRPLSEAVKLETGYKGVFRLLDADFLAEVYSHDQGAFLPDLARSNSGEYDEQVHAAYGVVSAGIGKASLQAGLRLEQAATEFHLENTGESFDNDYRSLFPSGLVAYNLTDTRQVKLSYSKRIQRPDSRLVNPFAFYEDPQNVFMGNPYLKPEYTHAVELGFQQSAQIGSLQLTPYFRRTEDAVRRIRTVGDGGITTSTFKNLATSESYGTDMTGSLRLGKVNGFAGFNVFKMVTDGSNVDSDLSTDALTWSARVNATWKVTPRLDAQGMYMYRAPMEIERGRMSGFSMAHLSLRHRLPGDKASVSLRVVDPFNTMGFTVRTSDERHVQESQRKFGARGVYLNFNYTFGRPPRMRQPRQEQGGDADPRSQMPVP